jgi:hypothetical protein
MAAVYQYATAAEVVAEGYCTEGVTIRARWGD